VAASTPTTTVTQTLPDSTAIEESHSGTGAIAATAYASCRLLLPPLAIEARRGVFRDPEMLSHPPTSELPLDRPRVVVAVVTLLFFVGLFMPTPIAM